MPDDDDYDDQPDESAVVKELRKQLKAAQSEAGTVSELRTELAILKADLGDLSEIQRKALLRTHEGDLTAEALKATAEGLGFVQAQQTEEPPQVPEAEQQQIERAQELTSGAPPAGATAPNVNDEINNAQSQDEVLAILRREGALADQ